MEKSFREQYDVQLKSAVQRDRAELEGCKDSIKIFEAYLMKQDAVINKLEQEKAQVIPSLVPANEKQ